MRGSCLATTFWLENRITKGNFAIELVVQRERVVSPSSMFLFHDKRVVQMKQFFAFFFFLLSSFSLGAQIVQPVKWSTEARALGGDEYLLVFRAEIDPKWAIYSQFLEGDDGPVPTSFTFDQGSHYERVGGVEESGPHRKDAFDPIFEMQLVKFYDEATFTQKVKVSDKSKPITGYLSFMTCDDTQCLPPTDVDFSFDLAKAPAVPAAEPEKSDAGEKGENEEVENKASSGSGGQQSGQEQAALPAADLPKGEAEGNADVQNDDAGILNPVSWSFTSKKLSEQEYELIFKADLQPGWSMYSQHTSDEGPVPTAFYFTESDHYELVGEVSEEGHKKEGPDPLFGGVTVIKFTEGPVVFRQKIKVTDPTRPIQGEVEFMTCDDERCLPPTPVGFSFDLMAGNAEATSPASETGFQPGSYELGGTPVDYSFDYSWSDRTCSEEEPPKKKQSGLWLIFLLGFGGGLFALLTPCVFPMIPLTVSFFTKSSGSRAKGLRNALTYGLSIIVIYVLLGLAVTMIFGADALNLLSTNAWFNIFFAVLFIAFAFSFFGYYEITLPSSWVNKSDKAAERGGLIGIFFMAFTLALVSFSCTGPIIGTLLVETATGGGPTIFGGIPAGPLMGMFGFATALALPFALFAAFPAWLNSLPKSGGWMNQVKVTLGFVEIALAMKFLSIADLTMGWKILPYELFLAVWVLCALLLGLYFLGYIRFPHEAPVQKLKPGRIVMALLSFGFVVYLLSGFRYSEQSGTFQTPPLLSGLAPPAGHSYIYPKECPLNLDCHHDFEEGLAAAKKQGKPILLDFSGYGCVNCRKMEDNVWSQDGIFELIRDQYVLISLYVDDRKKLDKPYTSPFSQRTMRTVGNKWADFQAIHFNRNSQPYYVLLSSDGKKVLNQPVAYTPDKEAYQAFLECGLANFKRYEADRLGDATQ